MTQSRSAYQWNIWFALFLRELASRASHSTFGYVWIVAEPVLHAAVLLVMFGAHAHIVAGGVEFIPFASVGVLGYRIFRTLTDKLMTAMDGYASVMVYPQIIPLDLVLVRFAYEVLLLVGLFALFLTGLTFAFPAALTFPSPWLSLSAFVLLCLFASGVGLCAFVARNLRPSFAKLFPMVTGNLYFVSGVFFSLGSLPDWAASIIGWNPVIHGIDLMREGMLQGFRSPTSLGYLALCALVAQLAGVSLYFVSRHKVSGRV